MNNRPNRPPPRGGGLVIAIALVLATLPVSAFAYLDPSTGSMIVSAIIGIFASVALAVKTYWYKLKNLFRRKDDPPSSSSSSASESSRDS